MTHISSHTQLIALSHQRLLKISGADSEKFLQGQTTCDIRRLAENAVLPGAHCDHKGRMHSSFMAARLWDGSVGLRIHESITESAQAALQKYAVFSKVQLTISDDTKVFAVLGAKASDAVNALATTAPGKDGQFSHGEGLVILRHDQESFEIWVREDQMNAAWRALTATGEQAAPDHWDLAQIALGLGQVRAETVGQFIPQMLNLQAVGGISFNKGCYTGQEVVARMHYLGKLKKHMYRAEASVTKTPSAGAPIFSPESTSAVGTVVMAAPVKTGVASLLFVCPEQAIDHPLHIGAPDGPRLQVEPLPYSLS